MAHYLTMPKKSQVLALLELGWSYRQIEAETGVRRETVSRYDRVRLGGHPKPATDGHLKTGHALIASVPGPARNRLPAARLDGHGHALRPDLLEPSEDQREYRVCRTELGVRQVSDRIWLVSFMDCDLGYFDDETCRLAPIANRLRKDLLPMSPE